MLVHVVAWKYKPDIDEDQRNDHRARLSDLKNHIPELIELHVGKDVLGLDRSFDTGLVAKFEGEAELDKYSNHPRHLEVATLGKSIAEQAISVDFHSDV